MKQFFFLWITVLAFVSVHASYDSISSSIFCNKFESLGVKNMCLRDLENASFVSKEAFKTCSKIGNEEEHLLTRCFQGILNKEFNYKESTECNSRKEVAQQISCYESRGRFVSKKDTREKILKAKVEEAQEALREKKYSALQRLLDEIQSLL